MNPRAAWTTYTLSRGTSSATWVFLHVSELLPLPIFSYVIRCDAMMIIHNHIVFVNNFFKRIFLHILVLLFLFFSKLFFCLRGSLESYYGLWLFVVSFVVSCRLTTLLSYQSSFTFATLFFTFFYFCNLRHYFHFTSFLFVHF